MKPIGLIVALAAVSSASLIPHAGVPASVYVRAPAHDSAIIQSHRLDGNFAYRTNEAHAYAVQTPVLGQKVVPVGVSYHKGTPIVKTTTDYKTHLVPQTGVATYQPPAQVVSQPIVAKQPVYAPAYAPATYAQGAALPAVHGGVYAHGGLAGAGYANAVPSAGVYAHGPHVATGYAHSVPSAGAYAHGAHSAAGYANAVPSAGVYAHGSHAAAGYANAVPSPGVYSHGGLAASGYGYAHNVPSTGVYSHGLPAAGGYDHAVPTSGVYAHGAPAVSEY